MQRIGFDSGIGSEHGGPGGNLLEVCGSPRQATTMLLASSKICSFKEL